MSGRTLVRNFAWQNVTEGFLTDALRRADMFGVSEADRSKLTRKQAPAFDRYFPVRDKKQAVLWKPDRLHVQGTGMIIFHRSGTAEGWDHIATPLRGLLYVNFQLGRHEYSFGEMHWLNSWKSLPGGRDQWSDDRLEIVQTTTIPKVQGWADRQHDRGRKVLLGGDTNSIPWDGKLGHGLVLVKKKGLDRAWVSDCDEIQDVEIHEGPITGVGPQLKHGSILLKGRLAA